MIGVLARLGRFGTKARTNHTNLVFWLFIFIGDTFSEMARLRGSTSHSRHQRYDTISLSKRHERGRGQGRDQRVRGWNRFFQYSRYEVEDFTR